MVHWQTAILESFQNIRMLYLFIITETFSCVTGNVWESRAFLPERLLSGGERRLICCGAQTGDWKELRVCAFSQIYCHKVRCCHKCHCMKIQALLYKGRVSPVALWWRIVRRLLWKIPMAIRWYSTLRLARITVWLDRPGNCLKESILQTRHRKLRCCCVIFRLPHSFLVNALHASALHFSCFSDLTTKPPHSITTAKTIFPAFSWLLDVTHCLC